MKEGYYADLSSEAYHQDVAIGSSGIKKFLECPALYQHEYLSDEAKNRKETASQSIGTYAHLSLLEPDLFSAKFIVSPEFAIVNKGKSNEAKKPMNKTHSDWKDFETEAQESGKEPLLYSDYMNALKMTKAIKEHELANAMLSHGKAEMSFFAKDEETGLMLKARPDYLVSVKDLGVVLVDYKTTAIALASGKQSNHAFNLGRHIQASHHKKVAELATGGKINEVLYVVQMQEAPYLIKIFRMPTEAITQGEEQCRNALNQMAKCKENNLYPDYAHEINDYIMPSWLGLESN